MCKQTAICKLSPPATCEHRIDGRLSHTILCGGNGLCDDVKKCPCRALAEIKELAATDSQQRHAARAKATLPPFPEFADLCFQHGIERGESDRLYRALQAATSA